MASRRRLLEVFIEVRKLLTLPDNNFDWSGWDDESDALVEIDPILVRLRSGEVMYSTIHFLPTGPLQEVSLSSGWGDEFVALADRFDEAVASAEDCPCFMSPLGLVETETSLGMDKNYAEVSLLACPKCGQQWVRYLDENEAHSGSGRWFLGAVDGETTTDSAKSALESALEYWCGGSYYNGETSLYFGPIR